MRKGVEMASKFKTFNQTPASKMQVERWITRFGVSSRVVKRTGSGQFVTNVSAKQMLKA